MTSYARLRDQLTSLGQEFHQWLTKPQYVVPFMQVPPQHLPDHSMIPRHPDWSSGASKGRGAGVWLGGRRQPQGGGGGTLVRKEPLATVDSDGLTSNLSQRQKPEGEASLEDDSYVVDVLLHVTKVAA